MAGLIPWFDVDSLDNRRPEMVAALATAIEPWLRRYHRAEVRGMERVPDGAALYVGNHSGSPWSVDAVLFGAAAFRAGGLDATPFVLAHDFLLGMYGPHQVLVPLGVIRADRDNARRVLERGHKLLVYPGGDEDGVRPFRHRHRIVFAGRTGYVRVAIETGVPVVPVVSAGAHSTYVVVDDLRWLARKLGLDRRYRIKVMPVVLSLPWGLTIGPPPPYIPLPSRILIEVMEPISFERTGPEAAADDEYVARCAEHVERAMQATLDGLAKERRAR